MFAILVVERPPLKLDTLPVALFLWILTAGCVAAGVALLVWLFTRFTGPKTPTGGGGSGGGMNWLGAILFAAVLAGIPFGMRALWNVLGWPVTIPQLPE